VTNDKLILLKVNEKELFDLIMLVYAAGNAGADGEQQPESAVLRRALFDKLHAAFEHSQCAAAR
jgi:hypothetical protein